MTELHTLAPAFVEMAHRIIYCTVATVDPTGQPRTRVLHPIWEWDGERLTGWIATTPASPKAAHLEHDNRISLTYWDASQDTCTADCRAHWEHEPEQRQVGWDRFLHGPEPVGFDPRLIPAWTAPDAEAFGILRLEPTSLRLMPGTLMTAGEGELMSWRQPDRLQ